MIERAPSRGSRRTAVMVLALFLGALSACSTAKVTRSGRVGWLESLDRGGPPKGRSVAGAAPSRRVREGLLQRLQRERQGKVQRTPYDSPDLDSVRLARWTRVARSLQLSWPLQNVHITSKFGMRKGDPHEGVDLRAARGTPVHAAHEGMVLYSGSGIRGYGKMVVIKHQSGLSTVYAHNSQLLVKKGQRVRRGQRVALSGSTGRSTGPHLHFEVRAGYRAVDPVRLIGLGPDPSKRPASRTRTRSTLAAASRLR